MSLKYVLVMDEGFLTWQDNPTNLHRMPVMGLDVGRWRYLGICAFITSNVSGLSPVILANVRTQIVLNLASGAELEHVARTFRYTPAQSECHARQLTRGEAIVKFTDGYKHPIHVRIPRYDGPTTVTDAEWQSARQRIRQLLPPNHDDIASGPPRTPQDAPAEKRTPRAANIAGPKPDTSQPAESAPQESSLPKAPSLGVNAHALLQASCQKFHPFTSASKAAGLSPAAALRARQHIVKQGLAHTERIVVRSGRGGTAVILVPEPHAYDLIGIKARHSTRGGDSIQHRYLVEAFGEITPHASVEATVAAKSVDVLIPYDEAKHTSLLAFLSNEGQPGKPLVLRMGDLVGLEIEASDPRKTAATNVVRNHDNGIALTIIAVLPKALDATTAALKKQLSPEHGPWIVVDALRLLDHLRATLGETTDA